MRIDYVVDSPRAALSLRQQMDIVAIANGSTRHVHHTVLAALRRKGLLVSDRTLTERGHRVVENLRSYKPRSTS